MQVFNYKKATQAALFFLRQAHTELHKIKLLKLFWLADRLHLRLYARSIFNDVYFGMQRGPVASGCKDLLEKSDFLSLEENEYSQQFLKIADKPGFIEQANPSQEVDLMVFSQTDLDALKLVFQHFGQLSYKELSELSHQYPEWARYERSLKGGGRFEMDYSHFFENPTNNHPIYAQSEEELATMKDWYLENQMLAGLV